MHNIYIIIMKPEELKEWRERTGYSQGQLAKALGVNTMTVSRWERGASPLPSFLLLALKQLEKTDDPTQRRIRKPKGRGKVHHKRALE
jgi:DNA-binding transcriptional regulator YiaG